VTTHLSPTTLPTGEAFRVLLEQQRADCIRQRELALAESATALPDAVAVSRSAALLRTIADIDSALARISAGTYGACVHCGEAIPPERLELRPFAAGCVGCEQRHH
jgi:RNA polymerase-binding transcription factor DksA